MIFGHKSVLLDETIESLDIKPDGIYVDGTLGGGGHASEVCRRLGDKGRFIGIDQDADAIAAASERLKEFGDKVTIVRSNYENIDEVLKELGISQVDGIYLDLGVSSYQLDTAERGFTYREDDAPLDMRMDAGDEESCHPKAEEILRTADIRELTEIFRDYGEERYAFQIAKGIVRHREHGGELHSTTELVELIRRILPAPVQRKMGGHPARKIFQALRIAVNDEINALSEALDGAAELLNPGGKAIVISYHSLEDRMVKHRFRKWKEDELGEPVPRKAILPTEEEIERNYKSRSAKLRIFQRYEEDDEKEGDEI